MNITSRLAVLLLAFASCGPETGLPEDTWATTQQGLVAFRSATSAQGLNVTSLTFSKPAGTVVNDLLLVRIASRNATMPSFTAPSGWSQLRTSASQTAIKDWIYFKVATASEPSSYVFTINAASSMQGQLLAFSGVDPLNPIDTSSGQSNTGTSINSPAVTTTVANVVGVWFGAKAHNSATCPENITPSAGTTEVIESCLASATAGLIESTSTKTFGTAGLQTALTGTSSVAAPSIGQTVALRPAGITNTCATYDTFATTYSTAFSFSGSGVLEPSGLAASRKNPGLLYTHNEDTKNLLVVGAGGVVAQYNLNFPFSIPMTATTLFDWEDLAVGPCPSGTCVYMADTGRSSGTFPSGTNRTQFAMYRVAEPTVGTTPNGSTLAGLERYPFQYPDGAYDAEALMVHPVTGTVYVLTKHDTKTRVYKFPTTLTPDVLATLIFVKEIALPTTTDVNYARTTAADIHPCGERFILRTYRRVYEFRATAGGAFETAFNATPIALTDTVEGQGESIAWKLDGTSYFTVSETPSSGVWNVKQVNKL